MINHHRHGRDGSEPQLCDVCFWRNRAESLLAALQKIAANPGDCDMETGYTSGHIARAAIREVTNLSRISEQQIRLRTKSNGIQ